ncbi:MAG: hypothetical protein NTY01_05200 [Verrucomicrobia bacterium]|nr:hypothetical protein [Verrucomicrobiota bacterium]
MQHQPATNSAAESGCSPALLTAAEWGLAAGALPAIAVGTNAPIGLAHWVLVAHYLAVAYGCHVLRSLRASPDLRLLRQTGFLLLIGGSLACAAASDAYTLVAARLPQAFGLACLLVAHSPDAVASRLPVGSAILGLLAGSLVGNLVGWRAVFVTAAVMSLVAAIRHWRREKTGCCLPEARSPQQQSPHRPGHHPMILAVGLAGIIAPVNFYCDFRAFGLAEAVTLAVGIGLFAVYAQAPVRELVASRSPLLSLWIGAVVAGLCLLPAIFHIQHLPAPNPGFAAIQTGCVLALAPIACALVLRLVQNAPLSLGRMAPTVGFLLLTGIILGARSWAAVESLPVLAAVATVVGAALGLAWTRSALRPVPMFSGLAAGVYAASYFLEFIPASLGSFSSPAAREFLHQESSVLFTAACVAFAGVGWSIMRAARTRISQQEGSGAGKGI